MSVEGVAAAVRTLDGRTLAGTLVAPGVAERAAVFVHGGGVTRNEGGFFTRMATGLAEAGVASMRFDLRGHGESEGHQEELTLSTILNDISAVIAQVREATGAAAVSLVGASFAGGITGYYTAKRPDDVDRLVMINPLIDYKKRFVDDKPYWTNNHIDDEAGQELAGQGFVAHSPTFKLGRALLNEVFWLKPGEVMAEIARPTLIIHGTQDTFIPVESSRTAAGRLRAEHRLVEIEGAQHGIAVHEDPQYLHPQTQEWQAFAIRTAADWITGRG
ncbi:alpha/beta hydrolase [Actinosynnema sp. CS-041913]|uniref:alpha/beta hydrolase n=1 Tax=Actinosynnema sp. CS-041913 TaxID=3239917 RepID=UPI003D945039